MVNIKDDVFEFDDLDELWALVKNMRAYAQVVVCRRGQMAQGVMDAIGRDAWFAEFTTNAARRIAPGQKSDPRLFSIYRNAARRH